MPGYGDRMGRTGRAYTGEYSDPETGELTEEAYKLIRRAAGLGLPRHAIARLLGMSPETFKHRRQKFPDIEEVFELGKAEADLTISNSLFTRARNGDMAAIRWYEMTRHGRAERTESETTTKSYVVEVPPKLDEDAWIKQFSPQDDAGST